jgi:hypothetical protein
MFNSIPVMGQRDLTIKWAIGAGKAKLPLIEKGYIVDDGGAFFGWGVEQGHLGKTEIFCKYNPRNVEAAAAVEQWQKSEGRRAFEERYFANLIPPVDKDIPAEVSHYDKWWKRIVAAVDPNEVSPPSGPLV